MTVPLSDTPHDGAKHDRLASLVEKLRPYLGHDEDCPALDCSDACLSIVEHACRCGLADLLTEMEKT